MKQRPLSQSVGAVHGAPTAPPLLAGVVVQMPRSLSQTRPDGQADVVIPVAPHAGSQKPAVPSFVHEPP